MKNRQAVLDLLDRGLAKLAEVKPKAGDATSAARLREGKEKVRTAKAKVAEEPADEPAPPPPPPVEPGAAPIYIGAYIKEGRTGSTVPWNGNYWTAFEQLSGCDMAIIHFGMKWGQFFPDTLGLCAARGSVPFLDVGPPGPLQEILDGKQDAAIKQMGEAFRAYGKPVLFRPMWEGNGPWFSWGRDPLYAAAWRYMHARIAPLAPNVSWVYCPNAIYDTASREALVSMYPGDGYVDWLGFDGYNWGTNPAKPDRWRSPQEVIAPTYDVLTELAPSKPIIIGEMASSEHGGSKADWITGLFDVLPGYPRIRAFCWFSWEIEENGGWMDWPPTTSPAAAAAWKAKLAGPYCRAAPNATTGGKLIVP